MSKTNRVQKPKTKTKPAVDAQPADPVVDAAATVVVDDAATVVDTAVTVEDDVEPVVDAAKPAKAANIANRDFIREHNDVFKRSGEVYRAPASAFRPHGHNVRDWTDPANIRFIEEAVATLDFTTKRGPTDYHLNDPLVVLPMLEDGKPVLDIEDGETRWRIALCAEGQEYAPGHKREALVSPGTILLPFILGKSGRTEIERTIDLYTQTGRRPKDLELAEAFQRLRDQGMTQTDIAAKIGKPGQQTYVSQILALRDDKVDPKVREALAADKIKTTTVVNAYRDAERSGLPAVAATKIILELVADLDVRESNEPPAAPKAARRPSAGKSRSTSSGRKPATKRVSARDVSVKMGQQVEHTAAPRAYNPANYNTFHQGIVNEARYSASAKTRDNMNFVLKRAGYHPEACLVDDTGVELPNAAEILEEHQRNLKRRSDAGEIDAADATVSESEVVGETDLGAEESTGSDAPEPEAEAPAPGEAAAVETPVAAPAAA